MNKNFIFIEPNEELLFIYTKDLIKYLILKESVISISMCIIIKKLFKFSRKITQRIFDNIFINNLIHYK
jgi:ribosome biogenesis protein Nip4